MKFLFFLFLVLSLLQFSCNPPNDKNKDKLFNVKNKNITINNAKIQDFSGKTFDFEELIKKDGNIKLISFWATWCGPCSIEYKQLQTVYKKWQRKYNFKIISVSLDKKNMLPHLPSYVEKKNWDFDFYYDMDSKLSKANHISTIPLGYLLDKEGQVVHIIQAYHDGLLVELEAMLQIMND